MVGRRRGAPQRQSRQDAERLRDSGSSIYEAMLAEAGVAGSHLSAADERPLKRRRAGTRTRDNDTEEGQESGDDEDVEFEDVEIPAPSVQTMERDSDEDSEDEDEDDSDIQFEDVSLSTHLEKPASPNEGSASDAPRELELNLSAQKAAAPAGRAAARRKPITREERERRVLVHQTHLLCLLSHLARRNHWCNDGRVQDALRPHLTDKMVRYLTPGTELTQFGRTESIKNGLKEVMGMWRTKFEIRERGLRRSLWAEDAERLKDYELPSDMDSCVDRDDFREAARRLQGSRDVGAQLFVALLRSVGIRARLVCSLQPLQFVSGGPSLRISKAHEKQKAGSRNSRSEQVMAQIARHRELLEGQGQGPQASASSPARSSARRRLGHPNATAYNFEPAPAPPRQESTFEAPKRIRESPHPVYWVEILDVGHQKWQPVDPLVTHTFWKPRALEPPLTDRENCLSYVVAFDGDSAAKDVTRRYAKAFTAKTLKLRVEKGTEDGEKWWRKALGRYRRGRPTDLDQIEDIELAGAEAREPMPRNVQDFKDHPVYALERHIRRHEVLAPGARPSGTVNTGGRTPLEKVYRRSDVRVAKTAEKWFRLGREVKPLQIPAKWLPQTSRAASRRDDMGGGGNEEAAGVPLYTQDQTDEYEPPPVRGGKVPKNMFGNIEVYTPGMVPRGGVHVVHEHAVRAAYILGVDYAPALTGFTFRGRQGTAVLSGVVVAREYEEAMRAVVQGLDDVARETEDEVRRMVALRLWRRFLMGLRIRERIWSGVSEEERRAADEEAARGDNRGRGVDEEEEEEEEEEAIEVKEQGGESEDTDELEMAEDEEGGGFLLD
ncbi:DNA repair protein rhp41 [Escovopsis weberi]|uniref:DNA repair protein rhp41 n=1 Tax=Escovopsis weberi TaxID=150374 RepID=A0A0M9VUM4_ESCWE|nr:DNA repair protein rhp41 [Escovopsis weberi]